MGDGQDTAQRQIENYALIGNCETAALVGRDGFIDWLCWPRFDSGACFAALLGRPEHGRWLIAPRDPGARVRRRYLDGSLILVTTFETADGAVELIDFLPPRDDGADLVRLIRGVRGRVELRTEFILRFDYGFSVPWIERLEDAGLRAVAGQVSCTSRSAISAKEPMRPSLMSSINPRALAIAKSKASGLIAGFAQGACTMPFTAAKFGAVQGSVIVVGGWQEAKLSRPWSSA